MERIRQKLRTRRALLDAARQIVAEGGTPTVPEAAERALVSRATAYRYFPTQDALLAEAPLDLDVPRAEDLFAPEADPPDDPAARVSLARAALHDFAVRNEREYRLFLRNWHDRWLRRDEDEAPEQRGARRVELLEQALAPLGGRVDRGTLRRLEIALSALVGVEALLVQQDVLRIDRAEAEAAFDWAARVLVQMASTGASAGRGAR